MRGRQRAKKKARDVVENETIKKKGNVFTLRVFPGDAPTLLSPLKSSGRDPLSRTVLAGGSTLLLLCQTQPRRFRKRSK